jgi:hypothetical protein
MLPPRPAGGAACKTGAFVIFPGVKTMTERLFSGDPALINF